MGQHRDKNEETHLLINVNEQILQHFGAGWDTPEPFIDRFNARECDALYPWFLGKLTIPEIYFFLGEQRYTVSRGNLRMLSFAWGAKDPRLSLTLPLWHKLLPEMKVIHIYRHGLDVALSLKERQDKLIANLQNGGSINSEASVFRTGIVRHTRRCCDLAEGVKLWEVYLKSARSHVQDFKNKALEIKYEDLLADPVAHCKMLCDFLDISSSEEIIADACAGIHPGNAYKYRHRPEVLSGVSAEACANIERVLYTGGYED